MYLQSSWTSLLLQISLKAHIFSPMSSLDGCCFSTDPGNLKSSARRIRNTNYYNRNWPMGQLQNPNTEESQTLCLAVPLISNHNKSFPTLPCVAARAPLCLRVYVNKHKPSQTIGARPQSQCVFWGIFSLACRSNADGIHTRADIAQTVYDGIRFRADVSCANKIASLSQPNSMQALKFFPCRRAAWDFENRKQAIVNHRRQELGPWYGACDGLRRFAISWYRPSQTFVNLRKPSQTPVGPRH